MRTLDELGISPTPWDTHDIAEMCTDNVAGWWISDADGNDLIMEIDGNSVEEKISNARLIAAAPLLYEDLSEACREFCFRCKHKDNKDAADICDQCIVSGWQETLAAASGESEARVWCKHDPTRHCVDCEI